MTRVAVLLSTYNGEKYLPEQISSLLAQRDVEVSLFVRDDGSRDASAQIVESSVGGALPLVLEKAANVGVIKSFFTLLAMAGDNFDYYAFCDQDDFWESDKLSAAARALDAVAGPRLYCSAVAYVDEQLHLIGTSNTVATPSFGNALIENIATGCTCVFDGQLRQLMLEHAPVDSVMHDWWAYLLGTALGSVVFDPVPRIRYRQHGGNVVGGDARLWVKWQRRLQRFLAQGGGAAHRQMDEFYRVFGTRLSGEQRALVERFLASGQHFGARIKLLFTPALRRQSRVDSLMIKVLILLGRF